jgi:hypothetical protein
MVFFQVFLEGGGVTGVAVVAATFPLEAGAAASAAMSDAAAASVSAPAQAGQVIVAKSDAKRHRPNCVVLRI